MRIRISTLGMANQTINSMLNQHSQIANTQEQLALGVKLVRPSDSPPAAVRALILDESLKQKEQYQANIDMARGRLAQEETVLDSIGDVLLRVHDLGVQSLNAPLGASDRDAIAGEMRHLLGEIGNLANTTTATGEYLFAGLQSKTKPYSGDPTNGAYTYNGDSGRRHTAIGSGYNLNDNDPGDAVFTVVAPATDPNAAPAAAENIMNLVFQFAEHLSADQPDTYDLARIQQSLEAISTARSSAGARLAALDQQETLTAKLTTDEKSLLSQTRDLDYTEAISRLNQETTALQAAQQAYSKVQKLSLFNYL